MPQQPFEGGKAGPEYEETVAPANPPNSVLRPDVRRAAVWTYLGILVAFFLIVGAAFLFWVATGPPVGSDERTDVSAVGTAGERMPRQNTPGGFDPAPRSGSTEAEIEYRGGDRNTGAITSLRALRGVSAQALAGRRVDLAGVQVDSADGGTFSVRDGDQRMTVVTTGGTPTVEAGQRIDLSGTLEQDGTATRIRARRIVIR